MCFGYIGKKNTHFQLVMEYGFKTRIPDCPEVEGEWAWTFLFIRIGLICKKQRRFCNCSHVFAKMFLHMICWKHHCNFQGDDPEILSKTKFCFWFGEHQLMWSNCWKTSFDSITHFCRRKADDNTTPNSVVCGKKIVSRTRNTQNKLRIVSGKKELWVGNVLVFLSAHSSSRQVSC